jgi:ketosteroid isomerase-like protein
MVGKNIERHRRLIDPFNSRDVDAFLELCDPQIEFHSTFSAVGGAVYHGHDGMRRYFEDIEEAWGTDFRVEPEAYFDLGEHTLAFSTLHGRGQQSGAEVELPTAQLCRWRGGLIILLKAYAHKEDALLDLGVSEDTLKPIAP